MPSDVPLQFGPYTVAGPQGPLWRAAEVVPLPPKALAVLWRLASQAGQVVTKAALLETVWADTVVSEGVLTRCLHTLRQALGEEAQQPRYIATVHRLGYRFVAPVTPRPPRAPAAVPVPPLLLGRAGEVAQLQACFAQAQQGVRQTVWVTGEAGVGKTTLVEACVQQLAAAETLWLGHGQCIEHYGAGEAYLPLLEALGRLGRAPGGARLVACLRQYAPTWLTHLPALGRPDALVAEAPPMPGATPARMLREFAEALEVLTVERPLVLVLEDLHWSDPSTVEALAWLARRREPARLLVVGTYRPVELILTDHPLKTVKQELVAHGLGVEIPLGGLSPEAVAAYVAQRRGAPAGHEALAAFVYQRTEGHPLFMVQMVDYLAQQHLLQGVAPTAVDRPGGAAMDQVVPQGLQDLLEAHLGRLTATEQQVLEVASVAGVEFVVASVAAGVHLAPDAVEAVCERLAQRGQFLEDRGLVTWPDGIVSGRYGFRHALYQEVVYKRIGAGRRARLHRRIGAREEAGYGARAGEHAAALAMHFARGGDAQQAVPYLQQAAANALTRCADREAIAHLTTALALLQALPETLERTRHELTVQIMLGPPMSAIKGYAAPEIEQAYLRARQLCEQVGGALDLFRVSFGLRALYLQRGMLQRAYECGEACLTLAQRQQDPVLLEAAHQALGTVLFCRGELVQARAHMEAGMTGTAGQHHRAQAMLYGHAPGVVCRSYLSWALWLLGYPEQAMQWSRDNLVLTRELRRPFSLTHAQSAAAQLHQSRREGPCTQAQAEATMALASEHGFAFFSARGAMLQGWALAAQGQTEAGMTQLHQGLAALRATETTLGQPYFLALLAEVYAWAGQTDAGLRVLDEALATVHQTGERVYEAELHRLTGELLLRQAGGVAGCLPCHAEVEARFQQALDTARCQQARALELRAATSLSRLWQQHGKHAAARELLAPLYGWFTEGFDTVDLQEAKALLEELGG